jgi:hypothetical protein
MYSYYDRYKNFLINGQQIVVPFISMAQKNSDKQYIYKENVSRLDKVSFEYYGTPLFIWLILSANPKFGGLESNIPDGSVLTIPFPLVTSLQDYNSQLENYFFYYGR